MSGTLFGLGLDGQLRWRYAATPLAGPIYPLVPGDATIAGLTTGGLLMLVDSQGRQITGVGGAATGAGNPGMGHDGSFYIPGSSALWAFRKDGTLRWSLPLDKGPRSAPAIDGNGTLYVGDASGHVRAVSAEGRVLWTYEAGGPVVAPPVIGSDGTIYVGSDDKKMHAITSAGASRWTFESDGPIRSAAAVARDGTVYVGSNDGRLYALRSDGSEKWSLAVPGAVFSPTILFDGTVVFASGDGVVRAVPDRGSGGLANAPWPKWACDLANTSRAPRPPARSF
jgi:outer membrane protein assembly factor BamB